MLKPGDIAIVSGARTPFGRYCGKLKDFTVPELGAIAGQGAIERSGIDPRNSITRFSATPNRLQETPSMAPGTWLCVPVCLWKRRPLR